MGLIDTRQLPLDLIPTMPREEVYMKQRSGILATDQYSYNFNPNPRCYWETPYCHDAEYNWLKQVVTPTLKNLFGNDATLADENINKISVSNFIMPEIPRCKAKVLTMNGYSLCDSGTHEISYKSVGEPTGIYFDDKHEPWLCSPPLVIKYVQYDEERNHEPHIQSLAFVKWGGMYCVPSGFVGFSEKAVSEFGDSLKVVAVRVLRFENKAMEIMRNAFSPIP